MKSLHYAAFKGRFDSLRIQIEDDPNININERDDKNMTPLHHACVNGYIDIVKLLLTKKARTDCRQNSNHATGMGRDRNFSRRDKTSRDTKTR